MAISDAVSSFDDLLKVAHAQPQPQRLLFVFASAELPDKPTELQKQQYKEREGGALDPVMVVDKLPSELGSFENLVEESTHTGKHWDIVFVTSMTGKDGVAPTSTEAEAPLNILIEHIKLGNLSRVIAFNRQGELLVVSPN